MSMPSGQCFAAARRIARERPEASCPWLRFGLPTFGGEAESSAPFDLAPSLPVAPPAAFPPPFGFPPASACAAPASPEAPRATSGAGASVPVESSLEPQPNAATKRIDATARTAAARNRPDRPSVKLRRAPVRAWRELRGCRSRRGIRCHPRQASRSIALSLTGLSRQISTPFVSGGAPNLCLPRVSSRTRLGRLGIRRPNAESMGPTTQPRIALWTAAGTPRPTVELAAKAGSRVGGRESEAGATSPDAVAEDDRVAGGNAFEFFHYIRKWLPGREVFSGFVDDSKPVGRFVVRFFRIPRLAEVVEVNG